MTSTGSAGGWSVRIAIPRTRPRWRGWTATSRPPRSGCRAAARRSRRSPIRRRCRSARDATTSWRRSATTRSSSSPARPARARPRSCPRSAWSWAAGSAARSPTPSRGASRRARSRSGSPTSSASTLGEAVGYAVRFTDRSSERTLVQLMHRRPAAGRDPARPAAAPLRHDHHRRGPRAHAEHRLPARLPAAAPAQAARPQAHHHLGDDRPRALRQALRRRADQSRSAAAPTRSRVRYRRWRRRRRPRRDQTDGDRRRRRRAPAREPRGDVLVFLRGEREIRDTADALRARLRDDIEVLPLYARLSNGRAAARSSSPHRRRASCWPPTSPRRRSPCRASAYVVDPGSARIQPLQRAAEGAAAADRADLAGLGRPAQGPLRTDARTASASGCTTSRTSASARASPTPRSCAPTSPR